MPRGPNKEKSIEPKRTSRSINRKKAPIAQPEEYSDDEAPIHHKNKSKKKQAEEEEEEEESEEVEEVVQKKKPAKKSVKKKQAAEADSEEEVVQKKSPKNKLAKKESMVDMVSYKFYIEDEEHPFFSLHNKLGSIDIENIRSEFDKEDVLFLIHIIIYISDIIYLRFFKFKKGDIINFVHSVGEDHYPVSAKINCDYIYSVKAASIKKGLLKVTDGTSLIQRKK